MDRHTLAVAFGLGLLLEAGPLWLASMLEPPLGWAIAPIGLVLAWGAVASARAPDGSLEVRRGLTGMAHDLGRLAALYVLGLVAAIITVVLGIVLIGLVLEGRPAGIAVFAATALALGPLLLVIPCLAESDDITMALDRALHLAFIRPLVAAPAVLGLAIAALAPPVAVALLVAGLPAPLPFVATLVALAASGPILFLGCGRIRPWLERRAMDADPLYGRV